MKAKLTTLFLPLLASLAGAQTTPNLMSYQARVTDASGALIGASSPVNRSVTFRLYTGSSGGSAIYAETQTVTISGGEFSVLIGNGTGVSGSPGPSAPATTPFTTLGTVLNTGVYASLYLGITVDDGVSTTVDAEISPRQQLVSGAFALRAQVAESVKAGSVTTAMIGDSQVNTNQINASAVTSAKIADGSIVAADIANNVITSAKLDAGTIGYWIPTNTNVYRNGNVGIGESNPGYPLNFSTANGDKISLSGTSGAHYGFGLQNNLLQIHTPTSAGDISFGYGSSGGMIETMRVRGNGNVGIGTASPVAKLDILGSVQLNGIAGRNYFKDGVKSDGSGLRVGEAWGMYGVYAETGMGVLGGAGGTSLQGNALVVNTSSNIGIGTTSPGARLHISEANGTNTSANTGTIILDHENSGSASSITFRSRTNRGSDYAYIQYQDDSGLGGTGEKSQLIIGNQNDGDDDILIWPSGRVGVKTNEVGNGTLTVAGNIVSQGSRNNTSGYARFYYDGSIGGVSIDVYNTRNNNGSFRGFNYDGDSNLDYYSDRRLKKDISEAEPMLDRLMQLEFHRFRWNDAKDPNEKHEFGVIAQEVQPLFPDIVAEGKGGMMTVGYTTFGTIACKAVQELKTETDTAVDSLKEEVDEVESRLKKELAEKDEKIATLEARLSALEKLLPPARQ